MNKYISNKYPFKANAQVLDFFRKNNTKQEFTCLELGCNAGQNLQALKEIYPNCHLYGIDILPEAIKKASQLLPNDYFMTLDIENNSHIFDKDYFDYILFPDVLEHLEQPKKVLEEYREYLKPDGLVIANIPNLMHWSIISKLLLRGLFTYTDMGLLDYNHKHLFTWEEIKRMFENCGYYIDHVFSIMINEIPEQLTPFFEDLVQASSERVNIIQYKTFTYMIKAHKVDN